MKNPPSPKRPPLKPRQYRLRNPVEIFKYGGVLKPDHVITSRLQKSRAPPIPHDFNLGGMCGAIDLDNQALLTAQEINKIRAYRLLAYKFEAAKPSIAQSAPESGFRRGLGCPQFPRTFCFVNAKPAHVADPFFLTRPLTPALSPFYGEREEAAIVRPAMSGRRIRARAERGRQICVTGNLQNVFRTLERA